LQIKIDKDRAITLFLLNFARNVEQFGDKIVLYGSAPFRYLYFHSFRPVRDLDFLVSDEKIILEIDSIVENTCNSISGLSNFSFRTKKKDIMVTSGAIKVYSWNILYFPKNDKRKKHKFKISATILNPLVNPIRKKILDRYSISGDSFLSTCIPEELIGDKIQSLLPKEDYFLPHAKRKKFATYIYDIWYATENIELDKKLVFTLFLEKCRERKIGYYSNEVFFDKDHTRAYELGWDYLRREVRTDLPSLSTVLDALRKLIE